MLDKLDAVKTQLDMNIISWRLHELSGQDKGTWAVDISENWRLTFRFIGDNAIDVDLMDYH